MNEDEKEGKSLNDEVEREIKKEIYFHLIPQKTKRILYFNIKEPSTKEINKVDRDMMSYIQSFTS